MARFHPFLYIDSSARLLFPDAHCYKTNARTRQDRTGQDRTFEAIEMKPTRLLLGVLVLNLSTAANASDCIEPNNRCTPVVGCILGEPNELFVGEVHGVGSGAFGVKSSQGATCIGTFRRTQFGLAKVQTTCDDGRTGRATFSYFHENTGTGRGKGRMSDGGRIVFWAGDRLWSYFRNISESRPDELITCAMKALEAPGPS